MVKCSYPMCPNDSSDESLTFHRFPNKRTNTQIWNAWLSILSQAKRRDVLNNKTGTDVICSKHFVEADFKYSRRGALLLPTSIPVCPVPRSVSFCDLEKNKAVKIPTPRIQGTLLRFIVDKKPAAKILKPLQMSSSKGILVSSRPYF